MKTQAETTGKVNQSMLTMPDQKTFESEVNKRIKLQNEERQKRFEIFKAVNKPIRDHYAALYSKNPEALKAYDLDVKNEIERIGAQSLKKPKWTADPFSQGADIPELKRFHPAELTNKLIVPAEVRTYHPPYGLVYLPEPLTTENGEYTYYPSNPDPLSGAPLGGAFKVSEGSGTVMANQFVGFSFNPTDMGYTAIELEFNPTGYIIMDSIEGEAIVELSAEFFIWDGQYKPFGGKQVYEAHTQKRSSYSFKNTQAWLTIEAGFDRIPNKSYMVGIQFSFALCANNSKIVISQQIFPDKFRMYLLS